MTKGIPAIHDNCGDSFLIICSQNCMRIFVIYLQLIRGILSVYDSAKINKIWYNYCKVLTEFK